MTLRSNQLSDYVCERIHWRNVENWKRVLAVLHASVREDVRDEVDAGVAQQRKSRGLGEEFDIGH